MNRCAVEQPEVRDKLLTVPELYRRLRQTEPVRAEYFSVGDRIRFEADSAANHGLKAKTPDEPVGVFATLRTGAQPRSYQLTAGSLREICQTFGVSRAYVNDCPPELLIPHMNYWFREGLYTKRGKGVDFQLVVGDGESVLAFTKAGLRPFSNVGLLTQAVKAINARYGPDADIMVDYKLQHTLRQTTIRLIVMNAWERLTDTGEPDDLWSVGIQARNSLTGQIQTSFDGYLFRWTCTNGQIDVRAGSGAYTRRKDATDAEVYTWARQAVYDVLGELDGAFEPIRSLARLRVEGNLAATLRDIFEHYRIPLAHRPRIIAILEAYEGEITMYVIMNAITQAANDPSLDPAVVESLMRVGGDFAHSAEQRCGSCHRMFHQH
jgi:hypothetical protein